MTSTALTKAAKRKHREHHEAIIRDGLKSMSYIGNSLREIRDQASYDDEYGTFEDYCLSVWRFTRGRAQQYITAVGVLDEMVALTKDDDPKATIVEMPSDEAQVRALKRYADDPESRMKLWLEAVSMAGDKPMTTGIIKKAAEKLFGPLPDEKPSNPRAEKPKPKTRSDATVVTEEESAETNDDPPVSDYRGHPSHGTTFNPSEWIPPEEPAETSLQKVPLHCVSIIDATRSLKDIRNRIIQLKKDLHVVCEQPEGSWFDGQETDRLIDQLFVEVKFRMYECPCPRCKTKVDPKCDRCGGRGWLDAGHARQNTDADKAWLEKLK